MAMLVVAATVSARPEWRVREFENWMTAEQQRVYLLCLRLLRTSDDADTATQDTLSEGLARHGARRG